MNADIDPNETSNVDNDNGVGYDSDANDNLVDVSDLDGDSGLATNNNEYSQDLRNVNSANSNVSTSVTSTDSESQVTDNEKNDDKLPDTGEEKSNNGTLFATLLAGLGSIILFRRRNKKKE
ncbi:LPXTG cell wall anchor domain-containing protein [Mammaliicoccus sciuri]|nr:LPXTG cell wall anchor domain-containing protein [Mammaliicoccus sciuri]MDU0267216.1 LPXTG cell wall anchor domain-containing protein [Mammaliicoccus sciuri]WQJ43537.1 LPXTG cell wall anchor domain-containing protein [Mammaliicoccus sciuri]WQL93968.1 LPXTG cell wall anchor domain-containing protein [Mammaliicoccus sciuri]